MDSTYGGEGPQRSEVKMSDKAVGERTSLVIKTICSWVQTPQVRSELRIKMKGFETQVIGQEPKVRLSVSLLWA